MPKIIWGALLPPLIIVSAFLLRYEQIFLLFQKDNGNVLTCYDCFRYALLTEQRIEGYVPGVNRFINVPDFVRNDEADRMITYLGTFLVNHLGFSKEFVYVVIPPLFATFFTIPLFLWIRRFAGSLTYLGAGILGTFNLIYWIRTSPGRYDTDFLILFFLFLTLWFVTLLVEEKDKLRAVTYSLLAGVSLNVFMWWYPKPIFVFLFSISLVLGGIAFKNSFSLLVTKLVVFVISSGMSNVVYGLKQLWGYIESRVFYEPSSFVPVSVSAYVVELQPLTLEDLTKFTTDNFLFLLFGFLGLLFIFVKRYKYMLVALPFIAMGLSSFFAGNRMLMYLSPFLGLGTGFLLEQLWFLLKDKLKNFRGLVHIVVYILVVIMTFPPYALAVKGKLLFQDSFYEELSSIRSKTEEGSFIWTWWDLGNVIQYTMRRGTYIDNGNWNIIKMYSIAYSFMSTDEHTIKNIIAYVSNNIGLDRKYKEKDYKTFLKDATSYPEPIRQDVYILVSTDIFMKPLVRLMGSYGTIYTPVAKPIGSEIYFCEEVGGVLDCGIISYDMINMKILSLEGEIKAVFVYDRLLKKELKKHMIDPFGIYNLYIIKSSGKYYSILLHNGMEKTNLSRWFLFRQIPEDFELVYDNFPLLSLYRIR